MALDTSIEELLKANDQKIDFAVSDKEQAILEELLADDYIYTHSNGKSQTKREYIDGAISRESVPPRRPLSEIQVEIHGDVAITRGNLDIVYEDERPNTFMRYVRVWRERNGKWQPISHRTLYATDRNPK